MKSSLKIKMKPKSETETDSKNEFSSVKRFENEPTPLVYTSINQSKIFDGSSMIVWNRKKSLQLSSNGNFNFRKI
jgi:hypothetical protein